ncbi:MAG: hypothetical protein U0T83_05245 [Bacteriovoracaceae bacterium]
MKKKGIINLFLFFLLIGLLIFTYYYEELRFFENKDEHKTEFDLAQDVKAIKQIKLKNVTIIFNGTHYELADSHQKINQEMIKNLFNHFSHFKIKRTLNEAEISEIVTTKKEALFFREEPFFVELLVEKNNGNVDHEKYVWGNYLGKDLGYYIKKTVNSKTEWLLVEDLSAMSGVYYADDDVNLVNYEKVKALLTGKVEDYLEKNDPPKVK